LKEAGTIVKHGDKVIYVFGKAVVPVEDLWEEHSYIGVNLDTGRVDDIRNNYVQEVRYSDLTEVQEDRLAQLIPIRRRLAKHVLVLTAKARSGKDKLADQVVNTFHAQKRSLADPIREIDMIISGNVKGKNRESLIKIGQGLRREDPNIWIKTWLRFVLDQVNNWGLYQRFVIPDIRQPNEFTFFKSMGALTVKIEADEQKRLDKIREVDGEDALKKELLNDETESHVEGFVAELYMYNAYDEIFLNDIDLVVVHALKERGW